MTPALPPVQPPQNPPPTITDEARPFTRPASTGRLRRHAMHRLKLVLADAHLRSVRAVIVEEDSRVPIQAVAERWRRLTGEIVERVVVIDRFWVAR